MFGVTIPHRLTAELSLHKGALGAQKVIHDFAVRYVDRLRTVNVFAAGELGRILPPFSSYTVLQKSEAGDR